MFRTTSIAISRSAPSARLSSPRALALLAPVPFLLLQLLLGADPGAVGLCAATITASLLPYVMSGLDLYSLLAALFGLRYVGIGLIAKSFYLQGIDERLTHPIPAFTLTFVLVGTCATLCAAARMLDFNKSPLPKVKNEDHLQHIARYSLIIGILSEVFIGATVSRRAGVGNSGAAFVIANTVASFYFLGLAAQAMLTYTVTKGRTFVSRELIVALAIGLALTLFLNVRGFLANALITVFVVAALLRALRWKHLAAGACAGLLFVGVLTPLTLALRQAKEGMSPSEYAGLLASTLETAIQNPNYFKELSERQEAAARNATGLVPYDYYGDRSNALNRLSYVALVDRVYDGSTRHELVGAVDISEAVSRAVPSFLAPEKKVRRYGQGDWLSWNMGLSEAGRAYYANFPLPMEGLAAFGIAGFVLYPALIFFPVLLIIGNISGFRAGSLTGIFFWICTQTYFVESTMDVYISMVLRTAPIFCLMIFAIFKFSAMKSGNRIKAMRASAQ